MYAISPKVITVIACALAYESGTEQTRHEKCYPGASRRNPNGNLADCTISESEMS
jgi:hypothetical protein